MLVTYKRYDFICECMTIMHVLTYNINITFERDLITNIVCHYNICLYFFYNYENKFVDICSQLRYDIIIEIMSL